MQYKAKLLLHIIANRAANTNLNSNQKKLAYFTKLELDLEKQIFLNYNWNSIKTVLVRVH